MKKPGKQIWRQNYKKTGKQTQLWRKKYFFFTWKKLSKNIWRKKLIWCDYPGYFFCLFGQSNGFCRGCLNACFDCKKIFLLLLPFFWFANAWFLPFFWLALSGIACAIFIVWLLVSSSALSKFSAKFYTWWSVQLPV